jgi:heme/copper-type cytochrome/quinol oxidase subunit 2
MQRHPQAWMGILLWLISGAVQAASKVNMSPGATEVSHSVFDLHMTIFWICVVIGALVFGVMFWSMLIRTLPREHPRGNPLDGNSAPDPDRHGRASDPNPSAYLR